MNTFRSLLAGKAPGTSPEVICLPDGNAPAKPRKRRFALPFSPPFTLPISLPFTLPAKSRTLRNRALMVLAALAVPAMAAPGDFGALPGSARSEASFGDLADQTEAMEFERPGMTFPGSAFFHLADPPPHSLIALPTTDALDDGMGEAGRELGSVIDAGPAARPFFNAGGASHLRAEECLAQAIWYEAASESEAGQRAVAQVVLNRVAHSSWPGSVCGVVYQGSERSTGCQFTFTCDGSLRRTARGRSWDRARAIAGEALSGSVYEPIGHATHYHTLWVNPYWASSLDHVGTIGAHRFYRNRGAAGEKGAFVSRYAGVEPGVLDRASSSGIGGRNEASPVIDHSAAADQRRTVAGPPDTSVDQSPAPILADPSFSGVGQVREDYARAGQWKSDAARAALEQDERAIASENAADLPADSGETTAP